jgi:murein L,D-transpeptidase YafK
VVSAAAVFGAALFIPPSLYTRTTTLDGIPSSDRSQAAIARVEPRLKAALALDGLSYGAPVFIRIFKDPGELEVWLRNADSGRFVLFRAYPVKCMSGNLGPKLREGDCQAPEGFYAVAPSQLNPLSRYHLSFNVGYPNDFDRHHDRTGSAIMVHGGRASIGCFAMGDGAIEEIFALAVAALRSGQEAFDCHIFPFRLTDPALSSHASSQWRPFWLNLKEGYDYFENKRLPPSVRVNNGAYAFE